jgi:hypothetical protein
MVNVWLRDVGGVRFNRADTFICEFVANVSRIIHYIFL